MTSTQSLNDLLGGSGPPSFKWEKVGDTLVGTLIDARNVQQTDIKDGTPMVWPDGNPRMQLVLTVRQDDGEEVRGFLKPGARAALQQAVAESGGEFQLNSRVAIKFSGEEPSKSAGMSAKKLWEAAYKPPAPAIDAADLLG